MITIEDLQRLASRNGGMCLSNKYVKCTTKYVWQCQNGHVFEKSWTNINRSDGVWCKECSRPSITLETLQKHALSKGGKCLSTKYINCKDKYLWECEHKHTWEATWINVGYKNATWCPECRNWTTEKFEKFAIEKGGKIICHVSSSGLDSRYVWECSDGHQWETKAGNIVFNGTWCKECQKLTLQDCIDEAEKKGGKCLDTEYNNKRTIMNWECKNGHRFKLRLGAVRNNDRWCRLCFHDSQRHDISVAHELARKNGGECLSTEYVNLVTPMVWRCNKGHEWKVAMAGIKSQGQWCPNCRRKTESACRDIFESIFGSPFPTRHLGTMERLELDGYNEEFGIAFEYNGRHHDKYVTHFHRNGVNDFYDQQISDDRKRELCEKNGITLIEIPSCYDYSNPELLEQFITEELSNLGM